ncbi:hypothetical protein JOC37_000122 [Desulfohalotomaculum tongense]|uniref:hypothetical protein n=1 Tax=Desulforadius tongensis TaxID=1216062 RepID=UPI0019560227|nr:hypothetical protein [Desulforadius tongensis]MBM7853757.1 hypothetical protein [Desulforadius tongensis]
MLVGTSTVLAMRCPECGKLEFHKLSVFSFSGQRVLEIRCSCGALLLLARKKKKNYWLQLPCVICETNHQRQVSGAQMWSQQVINLYCQETGIELGHIGPEEKVREAVQNYDYDLKALVEQFEGDDYFVNCDVMYRAINYLHDIAEAGALYCQCGNDDIEVDIFPDRLELHCRECDSVSIIYAETEEDLKVMEQVEYIELTRHGFEFLDSLSNSSGKSKNKKNHRKHNKR